MMNRFGGRKIGILIVLVFAGIVAGRVWAQGGAQNSDNNMVVQNNAEPAESGDTGVSVADNTVSEPGADVSKKGNVNLDFRDADIKNVLAVLAYKSGVNIVASPDVAGTVSITLNDVPWRDALDVILKTYGYAYERKGDNIILVTTIDKMKQQRQDASVLAEQEPIETRTFVLNFGKASEVVNSLGKMKSERGSIDFDDRTNTIIVTDISSRLDTMETVIHRLDATTPQVLIESKIIETTLRNGENLGVDWVAKASVTGSTRPTIWPFTPVTANKYIPDAFPATTEDFSNGSLNFAQMTAVMEILKTRTDTNILYNPRIVTLDNKAAQIDVGTEYPYPLKFFNNDTGTWQLSGWDYKKIGIILKVTPHVSQVGLITMDVEPIITEKLGDIVDVESGSVAPELSNESAKTSVVVPHGNTLVIGGLIKDKTTDTIRKIPLLGDIPIVGYLFKKKEYVKTKTDLLIFITPTIITPEIPAQK